MFEICGRESLIDVAIALEQAALSDQYFIQRKLYPNVDFYSGIIYKGKRLGERGESVFAVVTNSVACQCHDISDGLPYRLFPGIVW